MAFSVFRNPGNNPITMTRSLILLLVLSIPFAIPAQDLSVSTEQFIQEVNEKIPQLLNDYTVPGTALAIIDDGEVILQKGYGIADTETGAEVGITTGFNIGSISKTVAAWGVMNLVREGKIDLDDPVEKYLTRWHLPESEYDSDGVTIRRCLQHTAGLSLHGYPGWSPSDTLSTVEESLNGRNNGPGRVEIIHEPGSRYKYSGGGYTILQLIVEEVTGQKFEDYLQTAVIEPLGMTNSSYKIDERILAGSSREHDRYGGEIDFELFTAQAAAGFHTTIEDFTRFAMANLYQHEDYASSGPIIPAKVLKQMMENTPQAGGQYGYGTAYATHTIRAANMTLVGHRGANTGWMAIFAVNPLTNDGFVMFTNGGSGQDVYHAIYADWVFWKTGVKLEDWHYAKPSATTALKKAIDADGIDAAASAYQDLKANHSDKYRFDEGQMNQLGYHYLTSGEIDKSVAVFGINVDEYPKSFNVYDSYGEALLKQGNKEAGIENYMKSVLLNPGNDHGINVLKDLGVETDDLFFKVSDDQLNLVAGEYLMMYNPYWGITFEQKDGGLFGNDGGYRYQIYPVGENEFVNPDDGGSLVFDTSDEGAMMLHEKYRFRKMDYSKDKPSIARKLLNVIDSTGIDNIAEVYADLKKNHPEDFDFSEDRLNRLGYYYLSIDEIENALTIFKLNVEAFPNAHNVYDSYGEALLDSGDEKGAIRNYTKSVELNAGNLSAIRILTELGVATDGIAVKVPQPELLPLEGEYVMSGDDAWKIRIEEENGEMTGYDGEYEFELIPLGNDVLAVPDGAVKLVFDTKDPGSITFTLLEEYSFKKVR